MNDTIVNRVAQSDLQVIDLSELTPNKKQMRTLDIKDQLVDNLVLKEKPFRHFIKSNDWTLYTDYHVAIIPVDYAIVPSWAYMLVAQALQPFADAVIVGSTEQLYMHLLEKKLDATDWKIYQDAKIILKGCSQQDIPASAFVAVMNRLLPIASSIMYGEACSAVPIHKKKRP